MKPVNLNALNSPQQTKVQKSDSPRTTLSETSRQDASRESDKVNVSSRAEELGRLVDLARNLPSVRHERVAELKRLIDSGEYHVSSKRIADAILADEK